MTSDSASFDPAASEAEGGRLRRILDNVVAFVATLTPEGILTEVNLPAIEASDMRREDLIGRPFPDCYWWNFSEDSQARLWDAITRAAAGEHVRYDVEVRVAGDQRIFADFKLSPGLDVDGRLTELIASGVDITDRKNTEIALRQNEERLRVALDAGALGAWDLDLKTGRTVRSEQYDKIFGYDEPPEEWRLDDFLGHVVEEDRPRVQEALDRAIGTGETYRDEFRITRGDAETSWLSASAKLVQDDQGALTHMVGVVADVTERKSTAIEMNANDERLRLALDVGQMGVWDWDIASDKAQWSDNQFTLLGYDVNTVTPGFDAWRVRVHPDDIEEIDARISRATASGEGVSATYRLQHSDGRIVHVFSRSQFLCDPAGQAVRMIGVMADITELTEANLRADVSERRLDKIFGNAPVGLAFHDRKMRWRAVNTRFAEYVGLPMDDLIGKTPREFDAELGAIIEPVLSAAMDSTDPTHDVEVRLPARRSRQYSTYLFNCDVDRDAAGGVLGIIVAVQDITERKSAERQRQALLRELTHRVSNTLNVIQSIARQTLLGSPDSASFARSIIGRIDSLAATHALLTATEWRGADLRRLLTVQVGPVAGAGITRVRLEGPDVSCPAEFASNLGLMFHEHAVNALLHGALSTADGHIDVTWRIAADTLELGWFERGGPAIEAQPTVIGFGTRLARMSGAKVERIYDVGGLSLRMKMRLPSLPYPPESA